METPLTSSRLLPPLTSCERTVVIIQQFESEDNHGSITVADKNNMTDIVVISEKFPAR